MWWEGPEGFKVERKRWDRGACLPSVLWECLRLHHILPSSDEVTRSFSQTADHLKFLKPSFANTLKSSWNNAGPLPQLPNSSQSQSSTHGHFEENNDEEMFFSPPLHKQPVSEFTLRLPLLTSFKSLFTSITTNAPPYSTHRVQPVAYSTWYVV